MKWNREMRARARLTKVVTIWTVMALALQAGSSGRAVAATGPRHAAPLLAQQPGTILLAQAEAGGTAAWDASGTAASETYGTAASGSASARRDAVPSKTLRPAAPPRPAPKPAAVAAPRSCGKKCRVFVTSTTFTGELGGVDGADDKCTRAARSAGLGGRWQAWLSCQRCGPGGRGVDAGTRLRDAEYRLVGGDVVAASRDSMVGCQAQCLRSAIDRDESGHRISANGRLRVWTGTFGTGIGVGRPNCRDWTTAAVSEDGEVGELTRTSEDWTSRSALTSCGEESRLYCFEQ